MQCSFCLDISFMYFTRNIHMSYLFIVTKLVQAHIKIIGRQQHRSYLGLRKWKSCPWRLSHNQFLQYMHRQKVGFLNPLAAFCLTLPCYPPPPHTHTHSDICYCTVQIINCTFVFVCMTDVQLNIQGQGWRQGEIITSMKVGRGGRGFTSMNCRSMTSVFIFPQSGLCLIWRWTPAHDYSGGGESDEPKKNSTWNFLWRYDHQLHIFQFITKWTLAGIWTTCNKTWLLPKVWKESPFW